MKRSRTSAQHAVSSSFSVPSRGRHPRSHRRCDSLSPARGGRGHPGLPVCCCCRLVGRSAVEREERCVGTTSRVVLGGGEERVVGQEREKAEEGGGWGGARGGEWVCRWSSGLREVPLADPRLGQGRRREWAGQSRVAMTAYVHLSSRSSASCFLQHEVHVVILTQVHRKRVYSYFGGNKVRVA